MRPVGGVPFAAGPMRYWRSKESFALADLIADVFPDRVRG
jgi:hypothetical protein